MADLPMLLLAIFSYRIGDVCLHSFDMESKFSKQLRDRLFMDFFCLIPRMYQHVNILDPRGDILGPIYTLRFLSHATTAYDRPTT